MEFIWGEDGRLLGVAYIRDVYTGCRDKITLYVREQRANERRQATKDCWRESKKVSTTEVMRVSEYRYRIKTREVVTM